MEFTHDDWRYQALAHAEGDHFRVRLWYKRPGRKWAIGHSKRVPGGMSTNKAADIMRDFITGKITQAEYNTILPD